jgi:hypothetical protein
MSAMRRSVLVVAALVLSTGLTGGVARVAAQSLPRNECYLSGATSPQCSPFCVTTAPYAVTNSFNILTGSVSDGKMSNGIAQYVGARSDPGTPNCPINIWLKANPLVFNPQSNTTGEQCRYVVNSSSGTSIFVPFKSLNEWAQFAGARLPYISFLHCTEGTIVTLKADIGDPESPTYCGSPNPSSQQFQLPYAIWNQTTSPPTSETTPITLTATFNCTTNGGWVETATVTFTPTDSDYNNPSWVAGATTYTGASACGTDANAASANGPWVDNPSGLCSSGSTVDKSSENHSNGNWTWNCAPPSGSPVQCTAPIITPPINVGCAVETYSTQVVGSLVGNNARNSYCAGGSWINDLAYYSVGSTLNSNPTCCGTQYWYDFGEWQGLQSYYPGRFLVQWNFNISNTQNYDSAQAQVFPGNTYAEGVTVTDTYDGNVVSLGSQANTTGSAYCANTDNKGCGPAQ